MTWHERQYNALNQYHHSYQCDYECWDYLLIFLILAMSYGKSSSLLLINCLMSYTKCNKQKRMVLHLSVFESTNFILSTNIFCTNSFYHTSHLLTGFMGVPDGQLKSREKLSWLLNVPIILQSFGAWTSVVYFG